MPRQEKRMSDMISKRIEECEYAIEKRSNPEAVTITKLDAMINDIKYASFSAFAMADEKTLFFTSSRFSSGALGSKFGEALDRVCVARRKTVKSPWEVSVLTDNSPFHEGVLAISPDGQFLFVFRGSNKIFVQNLQQLSQGVNFVPIDQALNLKISDRQHISSMAITADGSTIYLCIDGGRHESKKGQGGYDIWYTTKMAGGWSELTNMGTDINTAGNEVSVSVLPDGKTLFFASDGLKGMGGYDIYSSTRVGGAWSKPMNLGYPINTPNNDVYYNTVPGNPRHAYYSVGRPDVADAYDTYFVNCYGKVLSDEEKASRRLEFLRALKKVRAKPVSPKTAKLLAKKKYSKLSEKTPTVERVKMILQRVKFSTNKSKLSPSSFKSLDVLCRWLRWHPGVRVKISGYTDNKGKKSANLKISRARAQSVANYLIKKGVYSEQIVVKGYGRKRPITSNKTAAGRTLNNRVEVSVIVR